MLLNDNPVMQDRNTSVGLFPWENESGAVDAFDLTNSQVMTDSTLSMVDEMDTRTEANVENENSTPEGADEARQEIKAAMLMDLTLDKTKDLKILWLLKE